MANLYNQLTTNLVRFSFTLRCFCFHNERFLMPYLLNFFTTSSRGLLGGWLIPRPGKGYAAMLRPLQTDFRDIAADATHDTRERNRKRNAIFGELIPDLFRSIAHEKIPGNFIFDFQQCSICTGNLLAATSQL